MGLLKLDLMHFALLNGHQPTGIKIGRSYLKVICLSVKLTNERDTVATLDYQLDGIYKYNRSKSRDSSVRDIQE